jgi:hypothetical protein
MLWTISTLPPISCFCIAALSRYVFCWTQSRYQIAAFFLLAGILWVFSKEVHWSSALACALAAAAGVIAVKLSLEGVGF